MVQGKRTISRPTRERRCAKVGVVQCRVTANTRYISRPAINIAFGCFTGLLQSLAWSAWASSELASRPPCAGHKGVPGAVDQNIV